MIEEGRICPCCGQRLKTHSAGGYSPDELKRMRRAHRPTWELVEALEAKLDEALHLLKIQKITSSNPKPTG